MQRIPSNKNRHLASIMALRGHTAITLAEKAGISTTCISQIINQRVQPKPETVQAIAKALKSTPAKLNLLEEASA